MTRKDIVRSIRLCGVNGDDFFVDTVKKGKHYIVGMYRAHDCHARLPYSMYSRYMEVLSPFGEYPQRYSIIEPERTVNHV